MRKRLLIVLLCAFGLLSSCLREEACDTFDRIEKYMDIYPDSALWLLNQISHPEKLYGKQRADYALLLTQAQDKNYLDSLQSDSLIKLAVDYYKDGDDKVKAGKALFYYGKMMALQEKDTLAMQTYLSALEKLQKTEEYKLKALVYEYMGYLNLDRRLHDDALSNYQESVDLYQKVGDSLGAVYIYRNIARIYNVEQEYDNVYKYVDLALSLCEKINNPTDVERIIPSLLHIKALAKREEGDFLGAISLLKAAIAGEKDINYIHHYVLSLGDIYLEKSVFDEAKKCFELALTSKRDYTQAGAYHYLYLLEKQQNKYVQALAYREKSDSLLKVVQDADQRNRIVTLQRRYEKGKLLLEKQQLVREKEALFYFWLSIVLLIIIFCIVSYSFIKRRYEDQFRKSMQIIAENKDMIQQYTSELEVLKQKEGEVAEKNKIKIGKLNQKILLLETQNKKILENAYINGAYLLVQLREKKLIVKKMSRTEKKQVLECIDIIYGGFISRLKEEFDLRDSHLMLATLLKIGFTMNDLMITYDCEINSVYRNKLRLKKRLHLETKDKVETFIALY